MKKEWNFNNSYATLPDFFFSKQNPTPAKAPQLVIFNEKLADELNLPSEMDIFAGNHIPKGAMPLAEAYAGHQFGHFTMLGDGRAILLGEHLTPTRRRIDIQLKGAGRTPYSRGGDGRAALGPMLREYIISEAMHHLGIPTTRSLAVVLTGEHLIRNQPSKGAVLTRLADSHLRVGTFEYAAHFGTKEEVKILADYTINRHFKYLADMPDRYLKLLQAVVSRQAQLIAKWQLVGFVHGVMNTDNMTISGETIDYGPCAFLDTYDKNKVFSSIDHQGRYAYGNQPEVAVWNLARFAEVLLPLLQADFETARRLATESIQSFKTIYEDYWLRGMGEKIGLKVIEKEDEQLIKELLSLMQKHQADYTNTFRYLTLDQSEENPLFMSDGFKDWHRLWQMRLSTVQGQTKEDIRHLMQHSNPAMIPRNHLVEEALEKAEIGDYDAMKKLLSALEKPYAYRSDQAIYVAQIPESACHYRTFCGT